MTDPSPDSPPRESFFGIVRQLGPAGVLAVISLSLPAIGGILLLARIDVVANWLEARAEFGLIIYVAAFAILAGLALLPTYAQAILGGWTFGFATGLPAALTGFLGGSLIGYAIARRASGQRVTRLIERHPKWAAVRDALIGSGALRTLGIVTLIRLPPNSPFAATNLLLASVRVPVVLFAVGTLLGMAPRTAAAVWIAHGFHRRFTSISEGLDQPKPWWVFLITIVLVVLILLLIGRIANAAIARVTSNGQT